MRYKNWFFDFDDTIASGATTWGIKYAFPKLIRQHQLPYDEALFKQALLEAQEVGSSTLNADPMPILGAMFETLGWSLDLRSQLLSDLQTDYVPEMYEDALPLMQHLKDAGCHIFVISNNPRVPIFIEKLPVRDYVERVFTPKLCGCQPKPHPSLWECVKASYPDLDLNSCVLIGDDPWSEGAFAQNCNLPCWIVDRLDRFADVQHPPDHIRVRSLAEITF